MTAMALANFNGGEREFFLGPECFGCHEQLPRPADHLLQATNVLRGEGGGEGNSCLQDLSDIENCR